MNFKWKLEKGKKLTFEDRVHNLACFEVVLNILRMKIKSGEDDISGEILVPVPKTTDPVCVIDPDVNILYASTAVNASILCDTCQACAVCEVTIPDFDNFFAIIYFISLI